MTSIWESKESGMRCKLLYVKDGSHWYEIPEIIGASPCRSDIFLDTMRPAPAIEPSPTSTTA